MNTRKPFFKFVAKVEVFCMIVMIAMGSSPSTAVKDEDYAGKQGVSIRIPLEIGEVVERYGEQPPRVVIVSTMHLNYQVNSNIYKILSHLDSVKKLSAVGLEGAVKDVDTSLIASFPRNDIKERVVDRFMRDDYIKGAEAFGALKNTPVLGIEDADLYQKDVNALLMSYVTWPKSIPVLYEVGDMLDSLEKNILSAELKRFRDDIILYRQGKLGLTDYQHKVNSYAEKQGIMLEEYPQWTSYVRVSEIASKIDLAKTKELAAMLMQDEKATSSEIKSFFTKPDNRKMLAKRKFRDIDMFVEYVDLSELINSHKLLNEERALVQRVSQSMCSTQIQKDLVFVSDYLQILAKYIMNQVARPEYEEFQQVLHQLPAKFDSLKAKYPVEMEQLSRRLYSLEPSIKRISMFYDIAKQRDNTFISRMEKQLSGDSWVAITMGGFHTKGVSDILKDKDISYMVVIPRVTKSEFDRKKYFSMLRGDLTLSYEQFLAQRLENPSVMDSEELSKNLVVGLVSLLLDEASENGMSAQEVKSIIDEWQGEFGAQKSEGQDFEFAMAEPFMNEDGEVFVPVEVADEPMIAIKIDQKGEQSIVSNDELVEAKKESVAEILVTAINESTDGGESLLESIGISTDGMPQDAEGMKDFIMQKLDSAAMQSVLGMETGAAEVADVGQEVKNLFNQLDSMKESNNFVLGEQQEPATATDEKRDDIASTLSKGVNVLPQAVSDIADLAKSRFQQSKTDDTAAAEPAVTPENTSEKLQELGLSKDDADALVLEYSKSEGGLEVLNARIDDISAAIDSINSDIAVVLNDQSLASDQFISPEAKTAIAKAFLNDPGLELPQKVDKNELGILARAASPDVNSEALTDNIKLEDIGTADPGIQAKVEDLKSQGIETVADLKSAIEDGKVEVREVASIVSDLKDMGVDVGTALDIPGLTAEAAGKIIDLASNTELSRSEKVKEVKQIMADIGIADASPQEMLEVLEAAGIESADADVKALVESIKSDPDIQSKLEAVGSEDGKNSVAAVLLEELQAAKGTDITVEEVKEILELADAIAPEVAEADVKEVSFAELASMDGGALLEEMKTAAAGVDGAEGKALAAGEILKESGLQLEKTSDAVQVLKAMDVTPRSSKVKDALSRLESSPSKLDDSRQSTVKTIADTVKQEKNGDNLSPQEMQEVMEIANAVGAEMPDQETGMSVDQLTSDIKQEMKAAADSVDTIGEKALVALQVLKEKGVNIESASDAIKAFAEAGIFAKDTVIERLVSNIAADDVKQDALDGKEGLTVVSVLLNEIKGEDLTQGEVAEVIELAAAIAPEVAEVQTVSASKLAAEDGGKVLTEMKSAAADVQGAENKSLAAMEVLKENGMELDGVSELLWALNEIGVDIKSQNVKAALQEIADNPSMITDSDKSPVSVLIEAVKAQKDGESLTVGELQEVLDIAQAVSSEAPAEQAAVSIGQLDEIKQEIQEAVSAVDGVEQKALVAIEILQEKGVSIESASDAIKAFAELEIFAEGSVAEQLVTSIASDTGKQEALDNGDQAAVSVLLNEIKGEDRTQGEVTEVMELAAAIAPEVAEVKTVTASQLSSENSGVLEKMQEAAGAVQGAGSKVMAALQVMKENGIQMESLTEAVKALVDAGALNIGEGVEGNIAENMISEPAKYDNAGKALLVTIIDDLKADSGDGKVSVEDIKAAVQLVDAVSADTDVDTLLDDVAISDIAPELVAQVDAETVGELKQAVQEGKIDITELGQLSQDLQDIGAVMEAPVQIDGISAEVVSQVEALKSDTDMGTREKAAEIKQILSDTNTDASVSQLLELFAAAGIEPKSADVKQALDNVLENPAAMDSGDKTPVGAFLDELASVKGSEPITAEERAEILELASLVSGDEPAQVISVQSLSEDIKTEMKEAAADVEGVEAKTEVVMEVMRENGVALANPSEIIQVLKEAGVIAEGTLLDDAATAVLTDRKSDLDDGNQSVERVLLEEVQDQKGSEPVTAQERKEIAAVASAIAPELETAEQTPAADISSGVVNEMKAAANTVAELGEKVKAALDVMQEMGVKADNVSEKLAAVQEAGIEPQDADVKLALDNVVKDKSLDSGDKTPLMALLNALVAVKGSDPITAEEIAEVIEIASAITADETVTTVPIQRVSEDIKNEMKEAAAAVVGVEAKAEVAMEVMKENGVALASPSEILQVLKDTGIIQEGSVIDEVVSAVVDNADKKAELDSGQETIIKVLVDELKEQKGSDPVTMDEIRDIIAVAQAAAPEMQEAEKTPAAAMSADVIEKVKTAANAVEGLEAKAEIALEVMAEMGVDVDGMSAGEKLGVLVSEGIITIDSENLQEAVANLTEQPANIDSSDESVLKVLVDEVKDVKGSNQLSGSEMKETLALARAIAPDSQEKTKTDYDNLSQDIKDEIKETAGGAETLGERVEIAAGIMEANGVTLENPSDMVKLVVDEGLVPEDSNVGTALESLRNDDATLDDMDSNPEAAMQILLSAVKESGATDDVSVRIGELEEAGASGMKEVKGLVDGASEKTGFDAIESSLDRMMDKLDEQGKNKKGITVVMAGVTLTDDAIQKAKNKYGIRLEGWDTKKREGSADVVIIQGNLENTPHPASTIAKANSILKTDGTLMINNVPNAAGISADAGAEGSLNKFTPDSVNQMVNLSGMSLDSLEKASGQSGVKDTLKDIAASLGVKIGEGEDAADKLGEIKEKLAERLSELASVYGDDYLGSAIGENVISKDGEGIVELWNGSIGPNANLSRQMNVTASKKEMTADWNQLSSNIRTALMALQSKEEMSPQQIGELLWFASKYMSVNNDMGESEEKSFFNDLVSEIRDSSGEELLKEVFELSQEEVGMIADEIEQLEQTYGGEVKGQKQQIQDMAAGYMEAGDQKPTDDYKLGNIAQLVSVVGKMLQETATLPLVPLDGLLEVSPYELMPENMSLVSKAIFRARDLIGELTGSSSSGSGSEQLTSNLSALLIMLGAT